MKNSVSSLPTKHVLAHLLTASHLGNLGTGHSYLSHAYQNAKVKTFWLPSHSPSQEKRNHHFRQGKEEEDLVCALAQELLTCAFSLFPSREEEKAFYPPSLQGMFLISLSALHCFLQTGRLPLYFKRRAFFFLLSLSSLPPYTLPTCTRLLRRTLHLYSLSLSCPLP